MKGITQPRIDAPCLRRDRGATMVEYAIVLVFVAMAFVAGALLFEDAISATFVGHQESVLEEMSNGDG